MRVNHGHRRLPPGRPDLLLATACVAWLAAAGPVRAQDLEGDRRAFADWLLTAPLSPYAAVALQPVGSGIVIGPDTADIPLTGFPAARAEESRGSLVLRQSGSTRVLPRNRPIAIGRYHLLASGSPGRMLLAVFGPVRDPRPPRYYPPAGGWSFTGALAPPERRGRFRTLGLDGAETEAIEAGFFTVPVAGTVVRLRVYRIGAADDEEAELQVFFRDSTNGRTTYPAGRFVALDPAGAGRFRLDFNRARNPFCAYRSVFPCPAPWPGNTIPASVTAGEQYANDHSGGSAAP